MLSSSITKAGKDDQVDQEQAAHGEHEKDDLVDQEQAARGEHEKDENVDKACDKAPSPFWSNK